MCVKKKRHRSHSVGGNAKFAYPMYKHTPMHLSLVKPVTFSKTAKTGWLRGLWVSYKALSLTRNVFYVVCTHSTISTRHNSRNIVSRYYMAKLYSYANKDRSYIIGAHIYSINRLILTIVIKNGKRFRNAPKRKKQVVLTLNFDTSHLFVDQHS